MQKKRLTKTFLSLSLAGALAASASTSYAAAFQIWEQSASGAGDYHAGAAASADTPSTEYYNPAGLMHLKHQQFSLGMSAIDTSIKYKGNVTVNTVVAGTSHNYTYTGINAQGGNTRIVPNFHYALPINDKWAFGFGVSVPLGLSTEYGDNTALRYLATDTLLLALNIGPSIAYRVNKHLSLGLGFDAQRLKAEFDEEATIPPVQQFDTTLTNKLYDWGYGFHAGALYEFTPSTRVGLTFHSQIVHHAEGNSVLAGKLADPNGLQYAEHRTNNAKGSFIMPAFTTLSFYQDINPTWAWMASATYVNWSSFHDLRLENAAGPGNTTVTIAVPQHFRNTFNLALGGIYTLNPRWQFKAGLGYDQTPVTDRYRTVQCPDNDRYALAIGAKYKPTESLGIEVSWAHMFLKQADVTMPITVGSETATPNGHVDTYANIFGLEVVYKFM